MDGGLLAPEDHLVRLRLADGVAAGGDVIVGSTADAVRGSQDPVRRDERTSAGATRDRSIVKLHFGVDLAIGYFRPSVYLTSPI